MVFKGYFIILRLYWESGCFFTILDFVDCIQWPDQFLLVFLIIAIAAGKDDYVYDLYAVKDDGTMMSEDALNIFPL